MSTVPNRVFAKPEDVRIENVVPKDVAESAAPAAKDWRGVVPGKIKISVKERDIGKMIPVVATATDRGRLERRGAREVERPPFDIEASC